ncbi:DUF3800 domain-containing protein [Pedobacter hiemivivus]|uniref:DUF3800 domain-containing protein n=1 Tax=Pedobacter hiemivivus TaxID=2530454 RepID=A0A4U1G6K3_9SPHI|nr:DUF3800 domain-containing protein [Pedobacter hiemivivus]TKC59335.1 DUF3800 domain-containing protein [Pedobacter hiemivivus]
MIAFADEFGNNSFEFSSQSTHFIVSSIIVGSDKLDLLENQLEQIRKRYFQTGEIKSNKVGPNHNRRLLILRDFCELDFSIYALIIDKKKLYGEGFRHKQSFYKYLNGLLYKELYKTFPSLILFVDEHGSNDYMKSFKNYVKKNHISNLFGGSEFEIKDSTEKIGIQLADFIAGTLGYIYDENKKSDSSPLLLKAIEKKINSISSFPREYHNYELNGNDSDNSFDPVISQLGQSRAIDFIEKTRATGQEELDQVNCVKLLLLYYRTHDHKRFISTKEILSHLNINRESELKEQYFRTKVIGKIRDKGVIISSSTIGYKLPSSTADIKKFINQGKKIILPMLNRIKICQQALKLATNNEIDILDNDDFKMLKEIINGWK